MDNKNNYQNNSGFGNGFVLGLLIGVVVTLLITTKRGRELFKELTEKGMDKFSDFEDKLKETTADVKREAEEYGDMEEEEGNDYMPEEPRPVKLSEKREQPRPQREEQQVHSQTQKAHPVRRFFRGKKS